MHTEALKGRSTLSATYKQTTHPTWQNVNNCLSLGTGYTGDQFSTSVCCFYNRGWKQTSKWGQRPHRFCWFISVTLCLVPRERTNARSAAWRPRIKEPPLQTSSLSSPPRFRRRPKSGVLKWQHNITGALTVIKVREARTSDQHLHSVLFRKGSATFPVTMTPLGGLRYSLALQCHEVRCQQLPPAADHQIFFFFLNRKRPQQQIQCLAGNN